MAELGKRTVSLSFFSMYTEFCRILHCCDIGQAKISSLQFESGNLFAVR